MTDHSQHFLLLVLVNLASIFDPLLVAGGGDLRSPSCPSQKRDAFPALLVLLNDRGWALQPAISWNVLMSERQGAGIRMWNRSKAINVVCELQVKSLFLL